MTGKPTNADLLAELKKLREEVAALKPPTITFGDTPPEDPEEVARQVDEAVRATKAPNGEELHARIMQGVMPATLEEGLR